MTTYNEMKRKVLALIEELNPNNANLTDDPDIAAKYMAVANQILFELARIKKIAKYIEIAVKEGDLVDYETISGELGYDVYQLGTVGGVNYSIKANGTVLKVLESGTMEIDCFVYPQMITAKNAEKYQYELSQDALEVMPYGIAADLLKSDVSTEYGTIYATRYESMKQMLDPRYHMTSVYIEGGVSI